MAKKSLIRQQIEEILDKEFQRCYIDKRKSGVRIKLCTKHPEYLTPKKKAAILALPNVVKTGYTKPTGNPRADYCNGITIHLSCSTKEVGPFSKKAEDLKIGDVLTAACNKFMVGDHGNQYLTKEKKYKVVNVSCDRIYIIDDEDDKHSFSFAFIKNEKLFINIV